MFCETFGNVTIEMVSTGKRGTCLKASFKDQSILFDICGMNPMMVPDGTNAYLFGNKVILVTRWSDMTDAEKEMVQSCKLTLALIPYECIQFSLKVGDNWGDVMVTLPACYKGQNDENGLVDEVIFIFADTHDSDFVVSRSVKLPMAMQKFIAKGNSFSYKKICLDDEIPDLKAEAENDECRDFYDYLYDECWNYIAPYNRAARKHEPDNIPDGIYIEINEDNKVTDMRQHEYVPPMSEEVKMYLDLANKGFAEGQYNLGVCYEHGDGVPQDFDKAAYWYKLAAAQGYAKAQYNLGVCYYNGYGVEKDDAEAARLYRLAAEQGDMYAQFNMGVCYYNGEGVEQDIFEAMDWLMKAAEQGHAQAKKVLGWE